MSNPKLLHMRSAVIGAQLAALAMRGSAIPADTAERMVADQLSNHNLVRTDVDLSQCGQTAAAKEEIRRMYALKMVELLFLRQDRQGMGIEKNNEALVREAWSLTQVMMEEDQTAGQLSTLANPPKAT